MSLCQWHWPEPAMTPGQRKCWKILQWTRAGKVWPVRHYHNQHTLLCTGNPSVWTHAHIALHGPSTRNRISPSVVAIGREHDRGYYTCKHAAGLFKSMNMDWDDHSVWTWITHVCQNRTTTGPACVPPTPLPPQRKKKGNQIWKNK